MLNDILNALREYALLIVGFATGQEYQRQRQRADAADTAVQVERRHRVRGDAVRTLPDSEFDERMRETDKRIRAVQSRAAERL